MERLGRDSLTTPTSQISDRSSKFLILKFWGHIFAPSSQQSAGIALKTSPIESYQFSTSKLCTNFFSNSSTKIIFFGLKKIYRFFSSKNIFSRFSRKSKNLVRFFFSRKFQQQKTGKYFLSEKKHFFFQPEKNNFCVGVGKKVGT